MSSEASPICFRVTGAERTLLEAVAFHEGENLSAFVRQAVNERASRILEDHGREKLLTDVAHRKVEEARERAQRQLEEAQQQLEEAQRATNDSGVGLQLAATRRPRRDRSV
jgi:uncharacterized protein (DUF1778 family)